MTISNKQLMVNLSTMVQRETLIEYIGEMPTGGSVLKFAWGENRFTIEHHAIRDWTLIIENIESGEIVCDEENIDTFYHEEILLKYL